MLYFLIKTENELQVCPVRPENESVFRLLYGSQILIQGISVPDVLRRLDELPVVIAQSW